MMNWKRSLSIDVLMRIWYLEISSSFGISAPEVEMSFLSSCWAIKEDNCFEMNNDIISGAQ